MNSSVEVPRPGPRGGKIAIEKHTKYGAYASDAMEGSPLGTMTRRMQSGMPFVAFDQTSKENRRTVRAHASKASAKARKATIARKQALKEGIRESEGVMPTELLSFNSSRSPGRTEPKAKNERDRMDVRVELQPPFTMLPRPAPQLESEGQLLPPLRPFGQVIWKATPALARIPRIVAESGHERRFPAVNAQGHNASLVSLSRPEKDMVRIIRAHTPRPTNTGPELASVHILRTS